MKSKMQNSAAGRLVLGVIAAGLLCSGLTGCRQTTQPQNLDSTQTPRETQTAMQTETQVMTHADSEEDLQTRTQESQASTAEDLHTKPTETQPAEDEITGTCGENLTWTFTTSSPCYLIIEGSGAMTDYAKPEDAPWYPYRNEISYIALWGEITNIGSNAFAGCENAGLDIPNCVTRIGENAFEGCKGFNYLSLAAQFQIGSGAFRNCDGLRLILSPEDRDTLDMDVFSTCPDLWEIWVMNRNCEISGKLGEGTQVTICGLPDSTAERYAQENGYAFNPMTENRDEIIGWLKENPASAYERDGEIWHSIGSLHYSGIVAVDGRFVTQILRSVRVSVTEEEIEQARQNGVIEINGEEYVYTESADQLKEAMDYSAEWDSWEDYEADAWIYQADNAYRDSIYKVLNEDGVYRFQAIIYYETDGYILTYEPCGWLWLDTDSPFSQNGELMTLGTGGMIYGQRPDLGNYVQQLAVRGEDEIFLVWSSAGKK